MHKAAKSILSGLAALLVALATALGIFDYRTNRRPTEVYRHPYPDGTRTLVISHIGDPIFPYGPDRMKITVLQGRKAVWDTLVLVANDGTRGRFSVAWEADAPVVTLSGDEMDDVVVRP